MKSASHIMFIVCGRMADKRCFGNDSDDSDRNLNHVPSRYLLRVTEGKNRHSKSRQSVSRPRVKLGTI